MQGLLKSFHLHFICTFGLFFRFYHRRHGFQSGGIQNVVVVEVCPRCCSYVAMVSMHRSIEGYTYIQSTVDITHGNSGGTLINTYGEVIGITTAGLNVGDVDYMNLSIPIQRVDTVALDDNESLLIVTKRHYPVYAKFYDGSKLLTSQTLKYEQTASKPSSSPSKIGYTFAGWYADSGLTKPFDFSTKILEDTRIYAKFDINNYNVTYNLNSGTWNGTTPDNTWTVNDCGTTLPTPVRSGYLFEGWTDSYGNFVDRLPTSSNLGNVTYSARWIEGAEGLVIKNDTVTDYNGTATSVKIPDSYRNISVTKIGNSAFSGATNLQSITLPDGITSIGNNTFTDSNIKEVYAPSIWAGTVAKQTNASTVVVTSGDTIGESAFSGCIYLTSITLPNELTSIGNLAFYNCSSLTSIEIPSSVTFIGGVVFLKCSAIEKITVAEGNTIYKSENNCLIEIATNTLILGCKNSIIPSWVTSIGGSAFSGCSGLTSIEIPNSVTSIGEGAFEGCNSLTSMTLPFVGNSLDSSGDLSSFKYIFGGDENIPITLKTVKIIGGKIEDFAFRNCYSLTSIELCYGVTSIGWGAFLRCSNLKSIKIPSSVERIEASAFERCSNLTIYAEASSKPSGWYSWNPDNRPVVWGYKGD